MLVLILLQVMSAIESKAIFHAGIDFRYSIGLHEAISGNELFTHAEPANAFSININGVYDITQQISTGIGLGTYINNMSVMEIGSTITQKPIVQFVPYLTLRYRPIKKHLNAYVFTDIGYAIPFKNTKNFSEGWMWNAGIGYNYMLRKHFGFNFNICYNLQQIIGTPAMAIDSTGRLSSMIAHNNLRHSISIAIGLVF